MIASPMRHWPFANGAGRIIDRSGCKVEASCGVRETISRSAMMPRGTGQRVERSRNTPLT
jgi:hypothetical protein